MLIVTCHLREIKTAVLNMVCFICEMRKASGEASEWTADVKIDIF